MFALAKLLSRKREGVLSGASGLSWKGVSGGLLSAVSVLIFLSSVSQVSAQSELELKIFRMNKEIGKLYAEGKIDTGTELSEKLVEFSRRNLGAEHPLTSVSMNNLGLLYSAQGRYAEAELLFEQSISINEKIAGAAHPGMVNSYENLASLCIALGKHQKAEGLLEKALSLREKLQGPDHSDNAFTLDKLGELYELQGKFEEAERSFLNALKIREKELGPTDLFTATTLSNLAALYVEMGRYPEAEPLYQRVDEAFRANGEKLNRQTVALLNNQAIFFTKTGRHEGAEELYRRILVFYEKETGWDHPETASVLNNLAEAVRAQDRYPEAVELHQRALKIREAKLEKNHPRTAVSMNNLAGLYRVMGQYKEAETLYERVYSIFQEQLGEDHVRTGSALNNLALLYDAQGKVDEASKLYEKAITLKEGQLGRDHPVTTNSIGNLLHLYFSQGKLEKAEPLALEYLDRVHRHHDRMLQYFPDRDCLVMQRELLTTKVAGNSLDGRLAAREQILFKGAVLEAMVGRRAREERLRDLPEGLKLLEEREQYTTAYARNVLSRGTDHATSLALRKQLDELNGQARGLLGEDEIDADVSISLSVVQGALADGEVLVELFRYDHRLKVDKWEPRYSSSVIGHTGKPLYLEHGKAESIENAIEEYRNVVTGEYEGTRPAAELLRDLEFILYGKILEPIASGLPAGASVVFSLDAQLHFLPLGMLRDEEGIPFGRKFRVRYVGSGRDVLKEVHDRGEEPTALVLGNPAFRDNAPLSALAEEAETGSGGPVSSAVRSGVGKKVGNLSLNPLPGTAEEIVRVEEKLEEAEYSVSILSRDLAKEETLRKSVEGHDVVHLATHGFFLQEIEINQDADVYSWAEVEEKPAPTIIQDPMYRSGLALAGAQSTFNLWKEGKVPPPSRDGILLAAEANLLNLRGTDLVVLSACETASGEALDGEGVMGLRRAFASAGANNTIMTLWPVNDESTVEVMDAFYEKYLGGTHPAIALAEVQNELYEPFVEKYGEVEAIARLAPFVCMSLGKVE